MYTVLRTNYDHATSVQGDNTAGPRSADSFAAGKADIVTDLRRSQKDDLSVGALQSHKLVKPSLREG